MSVQPFVGIAFLRGNPSRMWDRAIMGATHGPFVHTEFFLQRGDDVRMYTAANLFASDSCQNRQGRHPGFMPSARLKSFPDPAQWEIVRFPVSASGYLLTYALILQLLALDLPYNARDLWQCCIKVMLPFEQDLDCRNVDSWRRGGVFCSQVCLLLLRRLHLQGVLELCPTVAKSVKAVNSRGCSPNSLYRILALA